MNKIILFFLTSFLFLIQSSCIKTETGKYTIEYARQFSIDAGLNPLLTHVFSWTIKTNWKNFAAGNSIDETKVTKILPQRVQITPRLGGIVDYNFVQEAELFISNANNTFKIPIGRIVQDPNDSRTELFLNPGLADVKEYITGTEFYLDLELKFNRQIVSSTDHELNVQFGIYEQ